MPLENESGGYYYKTSQEADSPVINAEMMRRIPVEVNQRKIYNSNVSEEDAALLLLNSQQNSQNDEE